MNDEAERSLVSVIVPTYNRVGLLREAVESVLDQTYRPIELIVVDDGSTDETPEFLRKWRSSHQTETFCIRILRQGNEGASVARNRGLRCSRGKYIQFLDSDDLLSKEKIANQVRALSTGRQRRIAFCDTVFFENQPASGGDSAGRKHLPSSSNPSAWLTELFGWDGTRGLVAVHAWLTPRHVAETAGLWRQSLVCDDDSEYFTRAVLASSGVVRTEGAALYRRHEGERLSARHTAADWRDQLNAIRLIRGHLMGAADDTLVPRIEKLTARWLMQVAYRAYPDYPALSKVAQKWATQLDEDAKVPPPLTLKARVARRLVGWRGQRLLSALEQTLWNS